MTIESKKVTQFSTINALLGSQYDGVFPLSEVRGAGHFGLGCSHGMDGEALLHEAESLVARAGEPLRSLREADRLPFAEVVDFAAQGDFLAEGMDKDQLSQALVGRADSENLFIAVRITGRFARLKIRQPPPVEHPYPPMVEVLAHQAEEALTDVSGLMFGFWAPEAYQGVTVAGLHIHFVDDARTLGGHVLAFEIAHAKVEYETYAELDLRLPRTADFRHAKLPTGDNDEHIRQVEG